MYLAGCAGAGTEASDDMCAAVAVIGYVANWTATADPNTDAYWGVGSAASRPWGSSAERYGWTGAGGIGGAAAPMGYVMAG